MRRIEILNVPVDAVTHSEALAQIKAFLREQKPHMVTTPNPEMIVEAQRNFPFLEALKDADLAIPDGSGLLWAAKYMGSHLPERVTGVDVMTALCAEGGIGSVFLLGAAPGIAERAAAVLQEKNPGLHIAGTYSGSPLTSEETQILERINASGANVLFVAFGAPKQELWIARMLPKFTTVRVAMGVGGAFDFIAGKQKRAPRWMQRLKIEWLYRLIKEPRRYQRIINAVVVFPRLVRRSKVGARAM